jgi:hypothetical protein
LKLKVCDLLFLLADEETERLNVLSHVAISGSELTHLVALLAAQRGNRGFEFVHAVAVGKHSCVAAIALFYCGAKCVELLWYPVERRA